MSGAPTPTTTPLVVLIAAAGVGARMRRGLSADKVTPKQYLPLLGQPVILRSIAALAGIVGVARIVVVLHPDDNYWQELDLSTLDSDLPVDTVTGSDTRAKSVLAGLAHILNVVDAGDLPDNLRVLVHDAARPLVRRDAIERLIENVDTEQVCGGLLATPASDTLKIVATDGKVEKTLDRSLVWQAQTPQLFEARALHHAIETAVAAGLPVTDEASAMEMTGHQPLLVAGDTDNIKLTHSLDFPLAEILLRAQESE